MKATFAAGCFWHVEAAFQTLGVITTVGYMGGTTINPTYEDICTDATGHAEVVQIDYDPKKVTYKQLLDIFWHSHDATQKDRQGPDIGTQYRSAIFYRDAPQKKAAEESKKEQEKKLNKKIATVIVPTTTFYKAEEYHQDYFKKHGKVCG